MVVTAQAPAGLVIGCAVGFVGSTVDEGKFVSDPDRYFSLIARQEKRLLYVESIFGDLREAGRQLPPRPSYNDIAAALKTLKLSTSQRSDAGTNWVAQSAQDLLNLDGPDYSVGARDLDTDRNEGFLIAVQRSFAKTEATIKVAYGSDRLEYERKRLQRHLGRIRAVAREVRSIFGHPE